MGFTDEQLIAINSCDKDTLVSASAGSGKTTIMMERIVRMVTNQLSIGHSIPIDRMMIVTFTKAVAKELKNKISKSLMDAIKNNLGDKDVLRKQIEDLPLANVSTLHSLCTSIIRENFSFLNVDPAFMVLDEGEADVLLCRAINNICLKHAINYSNEYSILSSYLGIDQLNSIKNAYYKCKNQIDFDLYIEKVAKRAYELGLDNQPILDDFYIILRKKIKEAISYSKKVLAQADSVISLCERINKKVESAQTVLDWFEKLAQFKNVDDLEKLYALDSEVLSNGVLRLEKEDILVRNYAASIAEIYSRRANIKKLLDKVIIDGESVDNIKNQIKQNTKYIDEICAILKDVDVEYSRIKSSENKLDFNDLEHYMVTLLKDDMMSKTLSDKFDFVCVDEYQDINQVQEYILSKIATKQNLFMVGDIKQSIYGFRNTDPMVFLNKYRKYKHDNSQGIAVDLNSNFRSSGKILNFVNKIFNTIMTEDFGGIDYESNAQLVQGLHDYQDIEKHNIRVAAFCDEEIEIDATLPEDGIYSVRDHFAQEVRKKGLQEAKYIVNEIKKLVFKKQILDGKTYRPIEYKDIAILCYARTEKVQTILNEIIDAGLPIDVSNLAKESKNEIIKLLIAYLDIIDNPKQDISLATAMLSVLGNFTLTELVDIKKATNCTNYYESIEQYSTEEEILEKINSFNTKLNKYRFESQSMSVSALLNKIIEETLLDEYILSKDGGQRNLAQVRTFINSLKGKNYDVSISKFLSVYREYSDLDEVKSSSPSDSNCIKTATVHQSKGLEYPVVFFVDADKIIYNNNEAQQKMIVDENYGILMRLLDESRGSYLNNPLFTVAAYNRKNKDIEEKMRVLYVALTRAKEYLYVTGTVAKAADTAFADYDEESEIDPLAAKSLLSWIQMTCSKVPSFHDDYVVKNPNTTDSEGKLGEKYIVNEPSDELFGKMNQIMLNDYKYIDSTLNSMSHSVTEINKQSKQEDEEYWGTIPEIERIDAFESPKSAKAGTAYHKVLELIDFNVFNEYDIEEQMDAMVENKELTQEQKDLVNVKDILACMNSDLISAARKSIPQREKKFKLYLPANEILDTKITDKILVQGTFDLFIPKSDQQPYNILVDFKYSNASIEQIRKTYEKQLDIYKMALELCSGQKVDKKVIYVLGRNEQIEI